MFWPCTCFCLWLGSNLWSLFTAWETFTLVLYLISMVNSNVFYSAQLWTMYCAKSHRPDIGGTFRESASLIYCNRVILCTLMAGGLHASFLPLCNSIQTTVTMPLSWYCYLQCRALQNYVCTTYTVYWHMQINKRVCSPLGKLTPVGMVVVQPGKGEMGEWHLCILFFPSSFCQVLKIQPFQSL